MSCIYFQELKTFVFLSVFCYRFLVLFILVKCCTLYDFYFLKFIEIFVA